MQPLPSGSWTSQRPWPSAEVSHQQLQGQGKQASCRACAAHPARGPAVSPQSTAFWRGLPEAPQRLSRRPVHTTSCFPKCSHPTKGATIAAQDSLRAELSEFRESRKRRAAFSTNTQGETVHTTGLSPGNENPLLHKGIANLKPFHRTLLLQKSQSTLTFKGTK